MGPKTSGSSKSNWKGQNKHSESLNMLISHVDIPSGGASRSGSHGHGNSSLGQKRKLSPHEQKKRDSWITAKQELSPAEF